jgi:hypothetical protein
MAEPQITYRVAAHLSSKGDLAKSMKAKATAVGGLSSKFDAATSKTMAFGRSQTAAMTSAVGSIAKYSAAIGGMAVGGGIGLMVAKGAEFNVEMERTQNTIAGTLQLFNHSAGAADQLGTNIRVAGAALQRINEIADSAPGELQDIQQLFQNMLPGARSVTGEMKRIMDLTQSLAVYTPTLGGNFGLVGAQTSRMLTGGAGAEMEVWRTLQVPILKAGQAMEQTGKKGKMIFAANQQEGEKLTQAFNKLGKEDRLRVVEEAMKGGAADLAKMYAGSWDGASASAMSSMRKIAGSFTQPLFNATKAALIKANADGGAFGKENQAKLLTAASKIGGVLGVGLSKVLDGAGRAVTFVSNNWEKIANKIYHGMQIGAGMIKAAFAFGLAKMLIGAAAIGAASAARAVGGVGRAVGKGFGMSRAAIRGVGSFAGGLKRMVEVVTKGNPISNAMGAVTGLAKGFSMIAMAGVTLIPMLLVAGVVFGALSFALVGVAGVAVYVISKWKEITSTLSAGLANGTITMRPLIIAAMVLWEKLKAVGAALVGGASGGDMIKTAMNMAVGAINMVSNGVQLLMGVASGFLRFVAGAYNVLNPKQAILGGDMARIGEVLQSGLTSDGETARKIVERRKKEGVYDDGPLALTMGEKADRLADTFDEASKKWRDTDLKDLNMKDVDDLTKKADDYMKTLSEGDDKNKDKAKGTNVNIGHLTQQFDLRGEDPDRAMVAWVEPIERMARTPGGSSLDVGGY